MANMLDNDNWKGEGFAQLDNLSFKKYGFLTKKRRGLILKWQRGARNVSVVLSGSRTHGE